jgi:hypothetical protein
MPITNVRNRSFPFIAGGLTPRGDFGVESGHSFFPPENVSHNIKL